MIPDSLPRHPMVTRSPVGIAALCLASGLAWATASSPQDFAFGFRAEAEGTGPIWELTLPEAVYREVTRADLGDLRVFNAAGAVVPHALRLPKPPEIEAAPAVGLPVFALYRHRGEGGGQVLRIVTNERGAVIDASGATTPLDGTDRVEAYLIDASALEQPPSRLSLDWRLGESQGFVATVKVEGSDDLARWQTLVSDATVAELHAGESVLSQTEIDLPARKAKYLRVGWPEALRKIELSAVTAEFAPVASPAERQWLEIPGRPCGSESYCYEFDSGGHRAVDRARLVFPAGNMVLRGSLQSAPAPGGPWHTRHFGIHYSLRRDGALLESAPVDLRPVSDRYWRLAPEGGSTGDATSAPTLVLGSTPHQLRFVTQGEPPYTVAFRPLLATLDDGRLNGLEVPAKASEVFPLGGTARLRASRWRTWALWGVLAGALALLGWMVRRLLRQLGMGTPGTPTGPA
jgi:hypothetical protein